MAEETTLADAVAAFEEYDGINVNTVDLEDKGRLLVKVVDEDDIGAFFKVCREMDLSRSATTRDALATTVLDSWVRTDE